MCEYRSTEIFAIIQFQLNEIWHNNLLQKAILTYLQVTLPVEWGVERFSSSSQLVRFQLNFRESTQ